MKIHKKKESSKLKIKQKREWVKDYLRENDADQMAEMMNQLSKLRNDDKTIFKKKCTREKTYKHQPYSKFA